MTAPETLRQRARDFFAEFQDVVCAAVESVDGAASFKDDLWQREGGGGGRTRVMQNGALFEKAGVNFSEVHGEFPEEFARRLPVGSGLRFYATGVSLVFHPLTPFVPTVHANFRYLERGPGGWFGGGSDLTPYYPFIEDVVHFHRTLREACNSSDPTFYPRFKKWCDEYFFIKHRNESRGVGGVFFDYLTGEDRAGGIEDIFEFVRNVAGAFLSAYLPIAQRRRDCEYTERHREFQLIRRGRYAEFNLVYDRGTHFGLETKGRTESILMSLPPLVKWVYDYRPEPDSEEARAMEFFKPKDWFIESR